MSLLNELVIKVNFSHLANERVIYVPGYLDQERDIYSLLQV